jgi:hypothetical protein
VHACALLPQHPRIHYAIGQLLKDKRHWNVALGALQRSLRLEPLENKAQVARYDLSLPIKYCSICSILTQEALLCVPHFTHNKKHTLLMEQSQQKKTRHKMHACVLECDERIYIHYRK